MQDEGSRLAEFSLAVRESTLKRLRSIPMGCENWRPTPGALSCGEIAQHLLTADRWLFAKLEDPTLGGMVAKAERGSALTRVDFDRVLAALQESGERRAALCATVDSAGFSRMVPDDRFGGGVSVWWVVVRGNLDHEAHHRGQVATYLRILHDQGQGDGG